MQHMVGRELDCLFIQDNTSQTGHSRQFTIKLLKQNSKNHVVKYLFKIWGGKDNKANNPGQSTVDK